MIISSDSKAFKKDCNSKNPDKTFPLFFQEQINTDISIHVISKIGLEPYYNTVSYLVLKSNNMSFPLVDISLFIDSMAA